MKLGLTRKILLSAAGLILILVILNFQLLSYGVAQGYGQLKILLKAKSVEKVMLDDMVDAETKKKLKLVEEIRSFSIKNLGLSNSRNYTTLYDQQGKPVLWIVRACHPFRLENFEWTFPFVGTVSYKGYFNLEKALKLRDELKEEGYDTYIREVSAWSTLGWFKDPILSEMLKDPPGDLANTIIHELTHATIFVNDSITFNENLASFIGDKGAETFLQFRYPASNELREYQNLKTDRGAYATHFLKGAQYLDSLYSSFSDEEDIQQMEKLKNNAIQLIVDRLDTIQFNNAYFENRFEENLPNNAYFMSYLLYRSGQKSLDSLYSNAYNSDLVVFISEMKNLFPK